MFAAGCVSLEVRNFHHLTVAGHDRVGVDHLKSGAGTGLETELGKPEPRKALLALKAPLLTALIDLVRTRNLSDHVEGFLQRGGA